MNYIKLIFLILFFFLSPSLSAYYDVSTFDSNKNINNFSYIKKFPYKKYLDKTSFSNIKQLEKDRRYIQRTRKLGDDFLYHLSEKFTKIYPPKFSYMEKTIAIGEKFIAYNSKKGYRNDEIYKMIGYFILGKCGEELQKFSNKNYSNNKLKIDLLKNKLEKNKIYIKIKKNGFDKFIDNIEKGNIGYLFDRTWKKIKSLLPQDASSKLTLKKIKNNIYSISKEGKNIGQAIFLSRKIYKAYYIAKSYKNLTVYERYIRELKKNKKISKLVTSGGFSNFFKQPEGLTVEKGSIVNAILMPERHGLVLIQKDGGIRVVNLKRDGFTLPIGKNISSKKLSPLTNLIDYSYLISWMKKNNTTAFQTQLLSYSNKLLIDVNIAKNQIRERRFLVIASKGKPFKVHHIIINIEKGVNLAVATKDVFDMIRYRKFKVEAILNLDVGTYNILEAYSDSGKMIISAPIPLYKATNLLYYTK